MQDVGSPCPASPFCHFSLLGTLKSNGHQLTTWGSCHVIVTFEWLRSGKPAPVGQDLTKAKETNLKRSDPET